MIVNDDNITLTVDEISETIRPIKEKNKITVMQLDEVLVNVKDRILDNTYLSTSDNLFLMNQKDDTLRHFSKRPDDRNLRMQKKVAKMNKAMLKRLLPN